MPTERHTPQLDALGRWLRDLSGTWRVEVAVPDGEQAKLAWLAASGRDLLAITPVLTRALGSAIQSEAGRTLTSGGNLRAEATLRVAGDVIKAAVLGRVTAQGGDVTLTQLSGAWRAFKLAHRLDPRITVATGALLRALRAATFTLRRAA